MPLFKWRRLYSLILAALVLLLSGFLGVHLLSGEPLPIPPKEQSISREPVPEDLNEFLKLSMLDLNSATKEELIALPGIGETLAGRIVEYRNEHGPFESWSDVKQVRGIGSGKLETIRQEAYLGP